MVSNETVSVRKGFIISTLVFVGVVFSFIFYIRSDIYLPNDMNSVLDTLRSTTIEVEGHGIF